ncbi:MAG TPA: hypothetical protein PKK23_05960 [Nitrospirales bacterium]|nr:hypothetical protein [Nitrospiraceae bacterium]HNP28569.1 hypothetical protein [Nitrospirales bacterium]
MPDPVHPQTFVALGKLISEQAKTFKQKILQEEFLSLNASLLQIITIELLGRRTFSLEKIRINLLTKLFSAYLLTLQAKQIFGSTMGENSGQEGLYKFLA